MRKVSTWVLSLVVLMNVIGCNTARGVGEDVENTGKNIQKTIDKND